MADPRPDPTGAGGSTAGTPAWLKAVGILVLLGVVLFVVVMFVSGGGHGPPPGGH